MPPAQAGCPRGTCRSTRDDEFVSPYKIIVGGKNFGCGSSREHAPIALDAAGIEAVVAEFYARIFFRNAVNGGYLIPFETGDRLCEHVCTGDEFRIDVAKAVLHNLTTGEQWSLKPLGEVAPILEAGGLSRTRRRSGCSTSRTHGVITRVRSSVWASFQASSVPIGYQNVERMTWKGPRTAS